MAAELPIDQIREQTMAELRRWKPGDRLIISAPTGSGKSTRIPLWCRQAGHGKTLVIEPRRLACRTLATWVALSLGEEPGQSVGYSVRREQVGSAQSDIVFVTPGVARRMLSDRQIDAFATIIFDEFHERGWESDTVMAVLAARGKRAPRLLLMSATLQAENLSRTYGAKILEGVGRGFPVDVHYQTESSVVLPTPRELTDRVAWAVRSSWTGDGNMLVFLPGIAVMQELQKELRGLPVRLLHGSFSRPQQDEAFANGEATIVLATNVAESSLTIPGVTSVVDSGLEKRAIHQSGYVALATVPISQASADQRAGRAGRTAPGRCLRLWDPKARLEPTRPPDLCRLELDNLLLFLAGLEEGIHTPCLWLEPPPHFAWQRAWERLRAQALIDSQGRLTPLGRRAESLPVEPAWARILALAPEPVRHDLADLHAFSATRRSWISSRASSDQAEQRRADLGDDPWTRALAIMRRGEADKHGLDRETLQEARQVSQELRDLLGGPNACAGTRPHPDLKEFLARSWPERHFARRPHRDAWGNGEVECLAARSESIPEDCQAALFLRVEPVLGRGLKVELRGYAALPVALPLLRQCGYGRPEMTKIRFKNQTVTARVSRVFAGRVLGQSEEELHGPLLREALVELCRDGQWQDGLWNLWETFCYYENLRAALEGGQGVPQRDPSQELYQRLETLGLEEPQDLSLLDDTDLRPDFGESLQTLPTSYPRTYLYGGVSYEVSYHPPQRLVCLHWRSGPKGARPNPTQLPRWNGWKVQVDERGRVTPLRG